MLNGKCFSCSFPKVRSLEAAEIEQNGNHLFETLKRIAQVSFEIFSEIGFLLDFSGSMFAEGPSVLPNYQIFQYKYGTQLVPLASRDASSVLREFTLLLSLEIQKTDLEEAHVRKAK